MEKDGKNFFRFLSVTLMDTCSQTKTFSGNCSDRERCLSELRDIMPETTMEENRTARITNSRLFPVLTAASDNTNTDRMKITPSTVIPKEKGNSRRPYPALWGLAPV
jgi:hypothetical protein